ncbi:MAG: IspD/TarI family cytidylyltransferase [Spirochaetes bacterium]|nr:IspD/TarI family cytidylyltransferase [Spirochaetota bacterium]
MIPRRCAAIVTAAGASRRMGGQTKKEYRLIAGMPVLARAVLPFLAAGFSPVIVTIPAGHAEEAAALLRPHISLDAVRFVQGGGTRQESVFLGLCSLEGDAPRIVLIHDGARPWVSAELALRVAAAAEIHGACVPVTEATEAVKEIGQSGMILRHLRRPTIRFAQTPQGFHFDRILDAHRKAREAGARCVDDGEVFELFAGPVAWVPGDPENRKITRERDLEGA